MSVVFFKDAREHDSGLCLAGLNLLAHAQMIELFIGSECGGHGKCGRDRVILPEKARAQVNAPTAIERAHLKPEELEAGYRLACQCFPNSDDLALTVHLPSAAKGPAIPLP
jgi:2Fe-2S ferredoxin